MTTTPRIRRRLVPDDCIEVFEIRIAYYLQHNGHRMVRVHVSTPDCAEVEPELQDMLGVLEVAKLAWVESLENPQ